MTMSLFELSQLIEPTEDGERGPKLRTATVVTIGPTLTITLGGATVTAVALAMATFSVGDAVQVLTLPGARPLVLGGISSAPGDWHEVGGVGEPAFQNSWTNFGSGFQVVGFRKVGDIVYLRGLIKAPNATLTQTAFTLPAGYWPPVNAVYIGIADGSTGNARIDIGPAGAVVMQSGWSGTNGFVSFEGIQFSVTA